MKVIAGTDKGKTGRVTRSGPQARQSAGGRRVDGEAAHAAEPVEADQGRHRGAGELDRGFERDGADFGRRAHPRGLSHRRHGRFGAARPHRAQNAASRWTRKA